MKTDPLGEYRVLVALQRAIADIPGVLPTARGLSHFGEHALGWLGLSGVGALFDAPRRHRWLGLGAAAFLSHAASVVIKRVVRRPRPDHRDVKIGVGTPSKLSFPSSHATSTAAALVVAAKLAGRPWPLAGVPVMMLSRMVLGVHYPTDVAAGAALGVGTACTVNRYVSRKYKREF